MKMIGKKTAGASLFGVLVGAAALAAPAFACTQSAGLTSGADTGAPGSSLPLDGTQWNGPDAGGPIVIHWDGTAGPLLTVATGPSFKTSVTVPLSAAPGVYFVSAIQYSKTDGRVSWARSVVYEVTAPPAGGQPPPIQPPADGVQPPPIQPQTGGQPPLIQPPADGDQPPLIQPQTGGQPPPFQPQTGGQPPPFQPPAGSGQPPLIQPQTGGQPPLIQPSAGGQAGGGSAPAGNRGALNPAPASVGTGAPGPVASGAAGLTPRAAAGSLFFGPGTSGAGTAPVPSAGDPATPGVAADPQLVRVPVPGDLWSELKPGSAPSLIGPATSGGRHSAGTPVGVGLLAVGGLALAGTAAVTGRRRLALAKRTGKPLT